MCTGREVQVDDAETEKAREEKLSVLPDGLARRLFCVWRNARGLQHLAPDKSVQRDIEAKMLSYIVLVRKR